MRRKNLTEKIDLYFPPELGQWREHSRALEFQFHDGGSIVIPKSVSEDFDFYRDDFILELPASFVRLMKFEKWIFDPVKHQCSEAVLPREILERARQQKQGEKR